MGRSKQSPWNPMNVLKDPLYLIPVYGAYQRMLWVFNKGMGMLMPSMGAGPNMTGGKGTSGGFGFQNSGNTAGKGIPIPIVYGQTRIGGHFIQSWVEEGENRNQDLFVLLALGEGPVYSIGGKTADCDEVDGSELAGKVWINEKDIATYKDVKAWVRLGSAAQTPVFDKVVRAYNQSGFFLRKDAVFEWATKDAVNEVKVNLNFPQGLHSAMQKTGELAHFSIRVKIEVWNEAKTAIVNDVDGNACSGEFLIKEKRQNPFSRTFGFDNLQLGKYVVKVYRTRVGASGNIDQEENEQRRRYECEVSTLTEIVYAKLSYPYTSILGLKIRASNQINGAVAANNFRVEVKGRTVVTPTSTPAEAWSDNPAWIFRDAAENTRYGAGRIIASGTCEETSLQSFADRCDAIIAKWSGSGDTEKRFIFNGIIGDRQDAWEVLVGILSEFRAFPVKVGGRIRIKSEEPSLPARMLFNSGNIDFAAASVNYLNARTRKNAVEATFINSALDYKTDTIANPAAGLTDGTLYGMDTVRMMKVALKYTDSPTQVNRHAAYVLRSEMLRKAGSFVAGLDAIGLEPGDPFLLSLDTFADNTVFSGRILSSNASSTVLDQTIAFEAGKLYTLFEFNDSGASPTPAYWEQDFTLAVTTNTLEIPPPSGTAGKGHAFAIGEKLNVVEKCMATNITETGDGRFQIDWIPYDDYVMGDAAPSLDPTFYDWESNAGDIPDDVTDTLLDSETFVRVGISNLTATWTASAQAAKYAIWYRIAGLRDEVDAVETPWAKIGETELTTFSFDVDAVFGTAVEVAIQAISAFGRKARVTDLSAGAQDVYIISRNDALGLIQECPGDVTGLTMTQVSGNEYALSWDPVVDAEDYVVKRGAFQGGILMDEPATESTTVIVPQLLHYWAVRARKNGRYSKGDSRIIVGPPTHSGELAPYTSQAGYIEANWFGADVQSGTANGVGTFRNANRILWFNQDDAFLQVDPDIPLEYVTQGVDLGAVKLCHVSTVCRVLSWLNSEANGFFGSQGDTSPGGVIGKEYLNWVLSVQFGETGYDDVQPIARLWEGVVTDNNWNRNVVLSGRYFRLRFWGVPRIMPETNRRECLVCLEKLAATFHVEP